MIEVLKFVVVNLDRGLCILTTRQHTPPRRPRSKRKCWEVTDILHRAKVYDAESATRGAVEKLREASDRGFAASAV